jgi:DNA-directed RNA polymerase subunit RPC12/RpoP
MDLKKVLTLLGVDSLNEEQQEELKVGLQTLIDAKSDEKSAKIVEEKITEAKAALAEQMEAKFEEYKDDVTSKFSNFVDKILEAEMVIPEKVLKFAKQGELYEDLIEQFKTRLGIDEGLVNRETQELLREAKDEIVSLKGSVNSLMGDKLEIEKDAQEMAAKLYLGKKCDGLTESQRNQVVKLLDGVLVKEEIDKKYAIIVETLNLKEEEEPEEEPEEEKKTEKKKDVVTMAYECPECGAKASIKEGDDSKCAECGAAMKKVEEKEEDKKKDGKGKGELDEALKEDAKNILAENKTDELTPWQKMQKEWISKL